MRRRRSDGRNAYLRRVHGERVVLTHPCHPLAGRELEVLQYYARGSPRRVVVELPDGTAQCIPLSWTDRGGPSPRGQGRGRLSGEAVVELVRLLEAWGRGLDEPQGVADDLVS